MKMNRLVLITLLMLAVTGCKPDQEAQGFESKPEVIVCTQEYSPVCGMATVKEPIVCVTTPCIAPENTLLKTYGNRCMAKADKAPVVFEGECNTVEGAPAKDVNVQSLSQVRIGKGDPIEVVAVSRTEELLTFNVNYSGGCNDHSFELFADDAFAMADMMINEGPDYFMHQSYLVHSDNGDVCEGFVNMDVHFNLGPLKKEFYERFPNAKNGMLLSISAPANTSENPIEAIEYLVAEKPPVFCTKEYRPVCGSVVTSKPIVCVTAPCIVPPNHMLKTYSNQCEAKLGGAEILFQGTCGDKFEGEPVQNVNVQALGKRAIPQGKPVEVVNVIRTEELLTFNVNYSGGCGANSFELLADTMFMLDDVAGSFDNRSYFLHYSSEIDCQRWVNENIHFNLTPLKKAFFDNHREENAGIMLNINAPGAKPESTIEPVEYIVHRKPKGEVGDSCGGFMPWPGIPMCSAGLTCVVPKPGPNVPTDMPGTCQTID